MFQEGGGREEKKRQPNEACLPKINLRSDPGLDPFCLKIKLELNIF